MNEEFIPLSQHRAEINTLRDRFATKTAELRDEIWELEKRIEERDKFIGLLAQQGVWP